jgi:hypothetical protein
VNIRSYPARKSNRETIKEVREYNKLVTTKEIEKVIKYMKLNKASGPDGIHPFMIKYAASTLPKYLKTLFNIILLQGKNPDSWRRGTIIPIPKISKQVVPLDKLRPITLLSVNSKILGK